MTFFVARSRLRSKSARASSASASAERRSASSWVTSSLTSTSPFLASAPFSNLISLTVPPSSVETTAPCTALTDPTAVSIGGQSSSFTVALVTVVAGIVLGLLIILPICSALMPKTKTTMAPSRAIAMRRPLRRDFRRGCTGLSKTGLATSCISWFHVGFEQQAPQSARDLQLPCTALRRSHFLRTQHIQHQHPARDGKN